ncbi:uncharacterized protein BJ171DRAFT_97941 [Polychytrium aggregatum]|uniref:uncharacterized protein n=1 Tax=Polychytrium aggregatum TaxID=110093 RepID=UPI0022FE6D88|nr:uncharacterized protein BJ171DRAFT_97941 [Polychytrium aggregatum]KAI9204564.1 hypothetical protein BJ171DRAFT_97941 [Polychytrium aggregatum]
MSPFRLGTLLGPVASHSRVRMARSANRGAAFAGCVCFVLVVACASRWLGTTERPGDLVAPGHRPARRRTPFPTLSSARRVPELCGLPISRRLWSLESIVLGVWGLYAESRFSETATGANGTESNPMSDASALCRSIGGPHPGQQRQHALTPSVLSCGASAGSLLPIPKTRSRDVVFVVAHAP